ncbi:unnamed protein product [Amoebophrya sp. A25]|nr:unnamed protein product [Amoebophrya sp. A25]|eukprot:GSA25T00020740001.1
MNRRKRIMRIAKDDDMKTTDAEAESFEASCPCCSSDGQGRTLYSFPDRMFRILISSASIFFHNSHLVVNALSLHLHASSFLLKLLLQESCTYLHHPFFLHTTSQPEFSFSWTENGLDFDG